LYLSTAGQANAFAVLQSQPLPARVSYFSNSEEEKEFDYG